MRNITFMKIGELVKATGIPSTTIRFYVNKGLLPPPVKTGQTMAYYDDRHLRRLRQIKRLQKESKLPLAELKKKLPDIILETPEAIAANPPPLTEIQQKKGHDILHAATRVFSQKGYYRTTVNDITAEAHISVGTFYFYFKDKHQLYAEVVDSLIETLAEKREATLRGESDLLKRVTKRGRAIYEHFETYKQIIFLVRAEIGGEDPWASGKAFELYQSLSSSVSVDIRKAMEQGLIRPVDTKLLSYSLIGLIEIMSVLMTIESEYTIDQVLNFLTDFTLNGIRLK